MDIFYKAIVVLTVSVISYLDFEPLSFLTHKAYHLFFLIRWVASRQRYSGTT